MCMCMLAGCVAAQDATKATTTPPKPVKKTTASRAMAAKKTTVAVNTNPAMPGQVINRG